MILFLYNVALLAALTVSLPWWLWRVVVTEKYREGLLERLGRVKRLESGGKTSLILRERAMISACMLGRAFAIYFQELP